MEACVTVMQTLELVRTIWEYRRETSRPHYPV